jgi:CRISPR-associated protein Csb2
MRDATPKSGLAPWPLSDAAKLAETIRDRAAQRLANALPAHAAVIERIIVGRNADERNKEERIRIIPLPSIGHEYVVRSIRRVLIEVPPNCPLRTDDVIWSFSGLSLVEQIEPTTGEILKEVRLVLAEDVTMLRHYAIGGNRRYRVWRTVTAAALPERAARRRIDPLRLHEQRTAGRSQIPEAKSAQERLDEEARARVAVVHALRHAGISPPAHAIRVQREPFTARGAGAEVFAKDTRFAKERLWHVEITFAKPLGGPLVIGDGRYLGLGIMAPEKDVWRDVMVFTLRPGSEVPLGDGPEFLGAVRRAIMALAREPSGHVPPLFSGHAENGGKAASGRHEHIFLAADDHDSDGRIDRLVIAAPWVCDRLMQSKPEMRTIFDEVVSRLETVRAGRLGVIALSPPLSLNAGDPLIGPSRVWENRTSYRATRHAGRRKDPAAAVARDVAAECLRRGLPVPDVEILECSTIPNGGGLAAQLRLRFAVAIRGPLLLGRDSHTGGGAFSCLRIE